MHFCTMPLSYGRMNSRERQHFAVKIISSNSIEQKVLVNALDTRLSALQDQQNCTETQLARGNNDTDTLCALKTLGETSLFEITIDSPVFKDVQFANVNFTERYKMVLSLNDLNYHLRNSLILEFPTASW
jgi:hypothetical protein